MILAFKKSNRKRVNKGRRLVSLGFHSRPRQRNVYLICVINFILYNNLYFGTRLNFCGINISKFSALNILKKFLAATTSAGFSFIFHSDQTIKNVWAFRKRRILIKKS